MITNNCDNMFTKTNYHWVCNFQSGRKNTILAAFADWKSINYNLIISV